MNNYDFVVEYAKQLGIAFTRGDIEDILQWAKEDQQTDLRWTVWDYLDEFEGISHSRDLELFPNGDNDE